MRLADRKSLKVKAAQGRLVRSRQIHKERPFEDEGHLPFLFCLKNDGNESFDDAFQGQVVALLGDINCCS